jgi:two-component system, OmpR family, response regulator RstA
MSQEEKLPKILIVEDDERLARLTQEYLLQLCVGHDFIN